MKRGLTALALVSAFAAPAALADVTISGQVNMSIEYLNVGSESDIFANRRAVAVPGSDATPHDGVGNLGLGWTYTNITVASMEDLGGGLKLDFAAQIDFNTVSTAGITNSALFNNVGATVWSAGVGIKHTF
jgi:predicted porin